MNYELRITNYELFIDYPVLFRIKSYKNTTFLIGMRADDEEDQIQLQV